MINEKNLLKSHVNKGVYVLYSCFVMVSVGLLLLYSKKDLHVFINAYHNQFFDLFFKYTTYLGDGIIFAIIIIVSFFIKKREALKYTIAALLTLLVSSVLKQVVFPNFSRPIEVIGEQNLHLIKGVEMAHWHSFPSGHTMTVFIIATLLILRIKNKSIQFFIAVLAILTGFSRIYLSQHFLIDVLVGSLIGICLAILSVSILNRIGTKN